MTLRNFVLALGVALIVVGFAGFAWPSLLGMHLTPTHNGIHIVSGRAGVLHGLGPRRSRGARLPPHIRIVYAFWAWRGCFAPGLVARVIGHDGPLTAQALMADNLVHIGLGAAAGIVASSARHDATCRSPA